jgi:hypothetical protein
MAGTNWRDISRGTRSSVVDSAMNSCFVFVAHRIGMAAMFQAAER